MLRALNKEGIKKFTIERMRKITLFDVNLAFFMSRLRQIFPLTLLFSSTTLTFWAMCIGCSRVRLEKFAEGESAYNMLVGKELSMCDCFF
jgi:hypothetical protein